MLLVVVPLRPAEMCELSNCNAACQFMLRVCVCVCVLFNRVFIVSVTTVRFTSKMMNAVVSL